jgi:hypothetical protein
MAKQLGPGVFFCSWSLTSAAEADMVGVHVADLRSGERKKKISDRDGGGVQEAR